MEVQRVVPRPIGEDPSDHQDLNYTPYEALAKAIGRAVHSVRGDPDVSTFQIHTNMSAAAGAA